MIHMFRSRTSAGLESPPWRSFERLDAPRFPRTPPSGSVLARKTHPPIARLPPSIETRATWQLPPLCYDRASQSLLALSTESTRFPIKSAAVRVLPGLRSSLRHHIGRAFCPSDRSLCLAAGDGAEANEFSLASAAQPIAPQGTPSSPDLQTWTRNSGVTPDFVATDRSGGTQEEPRRVRN